MSTSVFFSSSFKRGVILLLFMCGSSWARTDRPLVPDRFVFNWHNFLSGCSTWNESDWNRWTDEAQKLGYNGIMVHAYGNNPMVSFTYNGKAKPVGYLSTTASGRDWSTMHVNDVRRMFGGSRFDKAVFGAEAAQVPEGERADAARTLMRRVFAHAADKGMNVFFANDVDTGSANPQELILTLPERARFAVQAKAGPMSGISGEGNRKIWLANPETPEGYAYYKAQVATLLADYPDISVLVAWFRISGTPWMELKLSELPAAWQKEYQAATAKQPEVEKKWKSANLMAIGKIVSAYERSLKDLGRQEVRLAAGSWRFDFLPGANLFFPKDIPLIGLDYEVLHNKSMLTAPERRQQLAAVGAHRPLIPVIWAHHDDGTYFGRPYTPFEDFYSKLEESKASGFGVIHWMTRPLDLFFVSHIRQVYEKTRNEPLRTTCEQMGGKELGEYLFRWVTEAPQFARETSDFFIDKPLENGSNVVAGCRQRLAMIRDAKGDQAEYFRGLEQFIASFYETQDLFQRSQDALKKNDVVLASKLIAQSRPEQVIEQFAKFISVGGATRGEQGLLVSLNLRWLTHFVRQRQALGMEPVRIKFGPTQHDMLAQSRGTFTFYFDADHQIWEVWGEQECGVKAFANPDASEEMNCTGIEIEKPLSLALCPIMAVDSRKKGSAATLPAGTYRLRLFSSGSCDVRVAGEVRRADTPEWSCDVTLANPGALEVTLSPIAGSCRVYGLVLEKR